MKKKKIPTIFAYFLSGTVISQMRSTLSRKLIGQNKCPTIEVYPFLAKMEIGGK